MAVPVDLIRWLIYFIPCVMALFAFLAARSLIARYSERSWVVALVVSLTVGFALGLCFTFLFQWPSDSVHPYIGFPLPWEYPGKGDLTQCRAWDDAALDMMLFTSVSVYPVWLAHALWRLLRRKTNGTTDVAANGQGSGPTDSSRAVVDNGPTQVEP